MSVDNLQDRLQAMQAPFKDAPLDAPGQKPWPPDDKYQALVKGFDFFESKDGVLFLKTILQIALHPEWDGAEVETIHNLEDPDRISWAKGHLHTLGIDVEQLDLGSLQGELERVLDVPVEIQIKTSDKKDANGVNYRNCYVNERRGNAMPRAQRADVSADTEGLNGDGQPAAAGAGKKTDDIPF
jgi:hypothetical protein